MDRGGGDVVGDVADHFERGARSAERGAASQIGPTQFQGVADYDLNVGNSALRIPRSALRRKARVFLHRNHPANPRREANRQGALSRPDLDHHVVRPRIDGIDDPIEDRAIGEEMLAEAPPHSANQDQEGAVVGGARGVCRDGGEHRIDHTRGRLAGMLLHQLQHAGFTKAVSRLVARVDDPV